MSVVQLRPKSTQNYSIFRRGQIARVMLERIIDQHPAFTNEFSADVLISKIELALINCPASSLVGNSWDDILQKCVEFLISRPHDYKEDDLKIRLFIRLLQHEQYA